jgi:hypothetical protein
LGVICGLLLIGVVFLLAGVVYLSSRYREAEASVRKTIKAHQAMLVGYSGRRGRQNHELMRGRDDEREGETETAGTDFERNMRSRRHAPAPDKMYVVYPPDMARYGSKREKTFARSHPANAKVALANLREPDPRLAFPIPPQRTISKTHRNSEKEQIATPAEELEDDEDEDEDENEDEVSAIGPSDISSSLRGEVSEISCTPEIVTRSVSKSAKGPKRVQR